MGILKIRPLKFTKVRMLLYLGITVKKCENDKFTKSEIKLWRSSYSNISFLFILADITSTTESFTSRLNPIWSIEVNLLVSSRLP